MAKKPTNKGNKVNDTTAPAPNKGKMTIDEKIEFYTNLVEKLKAEKNSLAQINNVQVGDENVTFKYGRGDKARELTGNIMAVEDHPSMGRMVAIQTGEGLDIKVLKVRAADIVSNPSADARGTDGDDPLNAA